jgi:hypothetical protein
MTLRLQYESIQAEFSKAQDELRVLRISDGSFKDGVQELIAYIGQVWMR